MVKWFFVIYIGFVTSFCFADLSVEREVVITPKGVNAAANIGSVNSSVNVRMDLAKVDIHIAKPRDDGLVTIPFRAYEAIDRLITVPLDGRVVTIPLNVIATFELINESSHDLNLTVGFPVSNSAYSSFELSHFSVVTDGTVKEVFRRKGNYPNALWHEYISGIKGSKNANPPLEKGAENLFGRQGIGKETFQNLMVWDETFSPAQRKKIQVEYEIEIPLQENKVVRERVFSSEKGISSKAANNVPIQFLQKIGSGSYYFFDYYLTSGASWAGTIGFEEITLHFDHWWKGNLEFYSTIKNNEIAWSNQTPDVTIPMTATYQFRDKEPTENIYFAIRPDIQSSPQKNTDQEEAKNRLAEGRLLWKKGKLEEALSTLYGAELYDLSNKQIVKVLKSMELQIEKINELLDKATTLIRKRDYKEAENILEKASLISSQYEAYQRVSQELTLYMPDDSLGSVDSISDGSYMPEDKHLGDRSSRSITSPEVSESVTKKEHSQVFYKKGKHTIVDILYGTDRKANQKNDDVEKFYTGERDELKYGVAQVSIPKTHKFGKMERPEGWLIWKEDETLGKHIMITKLENIKEKEFLKFLKRKLAHVKENDILVFIHGYNVTFPSAIRRTAQLAFDMNFTGVPMAYSWPSRGGESNYMYDEASVQYTAGHLATFFQTIINGKGDANIHLIGHSMGTRALTNALKEISFVYAGKHVFKNIILAAPDIDSDVFKSLLPYVRKTADMITLYVSEDDNALKASDILHKGERIGGQGGDAVFIYDSIDTIDATGIDTSLLGHSYFAEKEILVTDIKEVIIESLPPTERTSLIKKLKEKLTYWKIKLIKSKSEKQENLK